MTMVAVVKRTWLVATFHPEGPRELGGRCDIKNAFEGIGFEYEGTCEGM